MLDLSKYNIVGIIDLVENDYNIPRLYNTLKNLKKDDGFSPREKILIIHLDTEYFYLNHPIGFTMYNLFSAWRAADLPWHAMLLHTNHYGVESQLQKQWQFSDSDKPLIEFNIVNYVNLNNSKRFISDNGVKDIKHHMMCLVGGTIRSNRTALVKWLSHNNLLDTVHTSYSQPDNFVGSFGNSSTRATEHLAQGMDSSDIILDYVQSNVHRINESFLTTNADRFVEFIDEPVGPMSRKEFADDPKKFYNNYFAEVVCETVFDYVYPYFTEKTLRPLLLKTPFIMFGPPGMLNCLKDFGFKTFGAYWDESYDLETQSDLRFFKACNIIKQLSMLSVEQCQTMYRDMLPLLEHNRRCLLENIDRYSQLMCEPVKGQLKYLNNSK